VTSCVDCGRQLPTEDLVSTSRGLTCAPCHRERAAAEERRDSIDAAWAAVEAHAGWRVLRLAFDEGEEDEHRPWYVVTGAKPGELLVAAIGSTPAGALRALASKIAEGT
jgi:hypothetical protein